MTPKEIIKLADEVRKAATVAAAKAAELDGAVHAYWPDKTGKAPNPRWFAQSLRQQADVAAGLAHSMQLWAHDALTPTPGVTVAGHHTFPQETPPIPEEPQSPTTTGGEKE